MKTVLSRSLKLLVISSSAWDDNNSFGSTHSNLFSGWDRDAIANIYCKHGLPNTDVCHHFFQITEKGLIKNLLNQQQDAGHVVNQDKPPRLSDAKEFYYDFGHKYRLQILFIIREIIWRISRWQSKELAEFILSFNPDVIYVPMYSNMYVNNLALYVKKLTGKRMVSFVSDDVYTLKQFSLSIFYWLYRFVIRRKLREFVKSLDILYVISSKQKEEYNKAFNRECKLLYKGSEFKEFKHKKLELNSPIKLVYTGNIYSGRWQTLARIGRVLKELNKDGIKAQLFIYTQNAVSGKMCKALGVADSVFLMGGIPFNKVREVLLDADIVVHVESFGLKDRLETRLSFSTKLVDYFESGRCIFAVGWKNAASIDYLIQNDAAVVATSTGEMESKLKELISNHQLIMDYGQKAWNCGERNHQIATIKKQFHKALQELAYAK